MSAIEREVMMTGIGGQGVQLAAKILALAATREGREVMSLGTYGGTMRGGNTDATVVLSNTPNVPIRQAPIVSKTWSALIIHPRYFEPIRSKLRPDGVVLVDGDLLEEPLPPLRATVVEVKATLLAREAEAPKAAALVLLGAFAATTGIVSFEALESALAESLPPYRQEFLESNRRALAIGRDNVPALAKPAWKEESP